MCTCGTSRSLATWAARKIEPRSFWECTTSSGWSAAIRRASPGPTCSEHRKLGGPGQPPVRHAHPVALGRWLQVLVGGEERHPVPGRAELLQLELDGARDPSRLGVEVVGEDADVELGLRRRHRFTLAAGAPRTPDAGAVPEGQPLTGSADIWLPPAVARMIVVGPRSMREEQPAGLRLARAGSAGRRTAAGRSRPRIRWLPRRCC